MSILTINNISKTYNGILALRSVSFTVGKGEIVAILGPSGCGKSTLLSIIAGLEFPNEGEILWDGDSIASIPTYKRGFGLMFQDNMLFPHKNVHDNVIFGLEMLKYKKVEMDHRVDRVLEFVGLSDYRNRDVHTLSGGEQQRVALARSLAPNPRLLMLDEPFSSLDRNLRERLLYELRGILAIMNQTAIYVTHDQEEAFALADRIIVMDRGQVIQSGTPEAIYNKPVSEFVARFLGFKNFLWGTLQGKEVQISIGDSQFSISIADQMVSPGRDGSIQVLFRPNAVQIGEGGGYQISGKVKERSFHGILSKIVIIINGIEFTFDFQTNQHLPEVGEFITLYFTPQDAFQIL
jgi:ABC-type Fe3+/spermidine/putrescine transport system ATPase subunit